MDFTFTGVVKGITVETDKTGQNPFKKYNLLVEEETTSEYRDSVVLSIFDKNGTGEGLAKVYGDGNYDSLGHMPVVGEPATFEFHLRGSMGKSAKTGNDYAITDARCWKIKKMQMPQQDQQYMQQQYAAPQQPQFAQPAQGQYMQNPQQGFAQAGQPQYPAQPQYQPQQGWGGQNGGFQGNAPY